MKSAKFSKTNKLFVDAAEFLFVAWLIRRGIYSAFEVNYRHWVREDESFRNALHRNIQRYVYSDEFKLKDFINGAFSFSSTPEGFTFWCDQAAAWSSFCKNFQNKF